MRISTPQNETLEDVETSLLLEGMFRHYGFDFRNYAPASLKRRLSDSMREAGVSTISGFQEKLLHDPSSFEQFLRTLSVNVTSMFRDPTFYRTFRERVVPFLRTYPFIRIWHAGCSTGEEVYSMAILLKEEGIYDRCRIYATDMSVDSLRSAREGIFPLSSMQEYTNNYIRASGKKFFSEYYTAQYDGALFDPSLRLNVVFSEHNLVTDGSFNEFHVVLCRNVMIYFNRSLQERVHSLIYESLAKFGVLGIGNKESLRLTPCEELYVQLNEVDRLYRKVA